MGLAIELLGGADLRSGGAGLGDTQIKNFTLGKFDVGPPQKVTLGFGPLVAIPTSTSTNFGTKITAALHE